MPPARVSNLLTGSAAASQEVLEPLGAATRLCRLVHVDTAG